MSYQVLARKWRPRNFHQMVGQTHVLRALINALDNDRLHHAYLFTGTRGVGKTTIARILAKCLNCEQGVTSTPCGQCAACREIDEGRFVDLIEVDAASRTKVEDTRELLDNVQYAPTRGRYKVYLIDEVHMLSAHSFNALLKTLEEPPPHVKFLLATTDPQKLPITILSRCLQFSLKNMTPEGIVGHLSHVLGEEGVRFEESALWQLGRAADGSMRDALSLLDQAIAFGSGAVSEADVALMLGTLNRGQVYGLAEALAARSPAAMLEQVAHLAEQAPDYAQVLADLLSLLHRIALAQMLPAAIDNSQGDRQQVLDLAGRMLAEDVQLYYQIGLHGRRDLPLAPEPRIGFEMALLRMLAFRPDGVPNPPTQMLPESESQEALPQAEPVVAVPVAQTNEVVAAPAEPAPEPAEPKVQAQSSEPVLEAPASTAKKPEPDPPAATAVDVAPEPLQPAVSEPEQNEGLAPASEAGGPISAPAPSADVSRAVQGYADEVIEPASAVMDEQAQAEQAYNEYAAGLGMDVDFVGGDAPLSEPVQQAPVAPSEQSAVDHVAAEQAEIEQPKAKQTPVPRALDALDADSWMALCAELGLGGVTGTVANHAEVIEVSGDRIEMRVDQEHGMLFNPTHQQRIETALQNFFSAPGLKLEMSLGPIAYETPAQNRQRRQAIRLAQARQQLHGDPLVQRLQQELAAEVLEHTIAPID